MAEFQDITARDAHSAADFNPDVGVEHIADMYAKAVLDAAENAGHVEATREQFASLIADVLDPYPGLQAILSSVMVSPEEKEGVLDRVFGGKAEARFLLNFLKVVARHGRLDCLRAIQRGFESLYNERHGRVPVRLTTAAAIPPAQVEHLVAQLRAALEREPVVTAQVDPTLIGGAVIQVADTVYDGSVANHLRNIREKMIDRSAHEIQSRRDRFSHPAGN